MNTTYPSFCITQLLAKVEYNSPDKVLIPHSSNWLISIINDTERAVFPIKILFAFPSSAFLVYDFSQWFNWTPSIMQRRRKEINKQAKLNQNWRTEKKSAIFIPHPLYIQTCRQRKIVIGLRSIRTLRIDIFRFNSPLIVKDEKRRNISYFWSTPLNLVNVIHDNCLASSIEGP